MDPWSVGADLLIGAVIVGALLGLAIGSATWMLTRDRGGDPLRLARATGLGSVRRGQHHGVGVRAWQSSAGIRCIGRSCWGECCRQASSEGTLVDVGCGSGLMLRAAGRGSVVLARGRWPRDRPAPPLFQRLVGIELRPRVARLARRALGDAATVVEEDARRSTARCSVRQSCSSTCCT
jgi:hypothetical protein